MLYRYFGSASAVSMYSCEIRVGDIKEIQPEKKKCKNGENNTLLTNINKL